MQSTHSLLQEFSGIPITHGTLMSILKGYKTPNNKISRWLSEGVLIPLKKGLYLVAPEVSDTTCPLPLIANILYGPSCVSLDYALSLHSLIPEQVFEITSVTIHRSKYFKNSLGKFTYNHIPTELFSIGVDLIQTPQKKSYLLASSTKALCDKLLLLRNLHIYSLQSFHQFLIEDLRINDADLINLDLSIIEGYMAHNHKRSLYNYLHDLIKELK